MSEQQFAGMLPWGPAGLVSAEDERAMAAALVNPWSDQAEYLNAAADSLDYGSGTDNDLTEPNTFAYIPTEVQVGAAIAVLNMQIMTTPGPVMDSTPSLSQLSHSLYAQASQLWQEIAAADTEGWAV